MKSREGTHTHTCTGIHSGIHAPLWCAYMSKAPLLLILIGPHRRRFRPAFDPKSSKFPPSSDDQRQRSPPGCSPAWDVWLVDGWGGGAAVQSTGLAKSQAGLTEVARHKRFHAPGLRVPSLTDVRSEPTLPFKRALRPAVSNAALLFKVKPLRHPSCVGFLRWRLPDVQELFVGVLFVLVAAYALEQRHGEERVEDHYEEDVKVSVVVGLPEAGEANVLRAGAGRGRSRAAGRRSVCPLCFGSVLQELLAFGEERKQQGPVHLCHGAISNNRPKVPKQVKQTQLNNWESRTGLYPFRKGTPLAIRPLLIRRNASDKVHSSVPLGTSTSWPVWKFWFGPYLLI